MISSRFARLPTYLCMAFIFFYSFPAFSALLVDDCDGNGLRGHWTSYVDPHSYVSPNPFTYSIGGRSDLCARLDFELKPGLQYPYAGMTDSFPAQELSTYEGVRFWAKIGRAHV